MGNFSKIRWADQGDIALLLVITTKANSNRATPMDLESIIMWEEATMKASGYMVKRKVKVS